VSKSLPVGGISGYRGEAVSQYPASAGGCGNQEDTASGSCRGPCRTAAEEIHELYYRRWSLFSAAPGFV